MTRSLNRKGLPMNLLAKTVAALTLTCTAFSGAAFGDTYRHIDQLAVTIERQARQLQCEVSHYRHTPEYGLLIAETRQLTRLAEHVRDVAQHHGSLSQLQCDLRQLDSAFHRLERTLERIEDNAFRGYGHLNRGTVQVGRLMNSLEDNIRYLRDDIQDLNRVNHYDSRVYRGRTLDRVHSSYYRSVPVYPTRGITIGGGSSRFTIRF